jgi:light-regulated signal transduction histidine kinase (bacteriophytochrome)
MNQELEAFNYSVSHDLRAPLRHINGYLDALQESATAMLDAESQHYMTKITIAVNKMDMLIKGLLTLSRLDRQQLSKRQVDLAALVQDVIQEHTLETHGRELHWQIAKLPRVSGDPVMLRVVFRNLVSNALKYSRLRQPAIIEIDRLPSSKAEDILFVRDNGVGFDMAYADKLFEVFQRLHRVDEFEGTGIGLATVQRILHRHGGRIWVEAEIDQGATFYFTLPRERSS